MHTAAFDFVRRVVQSLPPLKRVLEFGSRNVNGTVREIFTDTRSIEGKFNVYYGIDLVAGPNVDSVADAADWKLPPDIPDSSKFDAVVCCEVLEHSSRFEDICKSAFLALKPGGFFIVTCASQAREPHSADGDGPPKPGEYYNGIAPSVLAWAMERMGFSVALTDNNAPVVDVYALALKAR